MGQSDTRELSNSAADRVGDTEIVVRDQLGALRGELRTMTGSCSGAAPSAFAGVHHAVERQATRIQDALQQLHGALADRP